jgi:hypothetical protein
MAGIIERNAKMPMTLRRRTGITDGKPSYDDFPCKGMLFDFNQADLDYFGKISNGTIVSGRKVLLAPLDGVVDTTCRIVIDGEENIIRAVRAIRNLKSEILGYKLAV